MVKERNFKCPICPRRTYSLRGMNWVSCDGTIADAVEIAPRIIEILESEVDV